MVGKARWLEHEVAGHIASPVRKQRDRNVGTQIHFSFLFHLNSGPYTQDESSLLSQPCLDNPSGSQPLVILDPLKLTINANGHGSCWLSSCPLLDSGRCQLSCLLHPSVEENILDLQVIFMRSALLSEEIPGDSNRV